MAGIDLATLLGAGQEHIDTTAIVQSQVEDKVNQIQQAGAEREAALRAAGENAALLTKVEELGKLRAQENARHIATTLGTNMDASSEIMTALGMQMRENFSAANAALDVIHQKESVSFWDDPVQYLADSFTISQDYEAYNYYADKYNLAENTMSQLNNLTTQAAQAQNAIAETRTAASVEAKAAAVQAEVDEKVARVKQENLALGIQGLKTVQDLNSAQLQTLFNMKSAVNSEKHLELAIAQFELDKKRAALDFQERQDRINQRKADQEELDMFAEVINTGRGIMNLPPVGKKEITQMMKLDGFRKQFEQQYMIGASYNATGQKMIATTPGEAVVLLLQSGVRQVAPTQEPIRQFIMANMPSAEDLTKKGIDAKDPKAVANFVNNRTKASIERMAGNIKAGDATNIYAAAPLPELLQYKGLQQTAFAMKVLAPAVKAGMVETNPEQIVSLATAAIKRGDISYNDAVRDITLLFKSAVDLNNRTKEYTKFGLPRQDKYITTLESRLGVGIKQDLTNEAVVGHAVANKLKGFLFGATGGFGIVN